MAGSGNQVEEGRPRGDRGGASERDGRGVLGGDAEPAGNEAAEDVPIAELPPRLVPHRLVSAEAGVEGRRHAAVQRPQAHQAEVLEILDLMA